jgi:2-oxoglutarate dehydrogenase E1 component
MDFWREFHGPNAGYIVECYERYRDDPASIDADMRAFFDRLSLIKLKLCGMENRHRLQRGNARDPYETAICELDVEKIAAVNNLAQSIRWYGHFAA